LKTQSGAGLVSLFFGKQGELRGRSFDDHVGRLVEQLRAEGHTIDHATLALTTVTLR